MAKNVIFEVKKSQKVDKKELSRHKELIGWLIAKNRKKQIEIMAKDLLKKNFIGQKWHKTRFESKNHFDMPKKTEISIL